MEIAGAIFVIGLIFYALWRQVMDNLTKQCPNCGQRIKDRAAVCPFCAHRFPRPQG